ncbi:MAG: M48 family metallopeptidase [Bdellovibrionales bacterium]
MSYFKPVIASELNTCKSSRCEKKNMLASFALAAVVVCAGAVTAPQSANLLPFIFVSYGALTVSLMAASSIITRFLLTKKEVASWNRNRYEDLQRTAKEYSNKLGLKKTPQIRIWRKYVSILGPASIPFCGVIFEESSFDKYSQGQLRAICGHELAHVKKKHVWKEACLSVLSAAGVTLAPALWPSVILLPRFLARQNEFQADRIGAVLSEFPQPFASLLKEYDSDTYIKRMDEWHSSSFSQKVVKCALAPTRMILRSCGYLFLACHPATERRVERLESIGNPPSRYETDSLKAMFVRLAL